MAHQLETLENGETAMFSGRNKTPWHGLGTVISGLATAEEALKLAHLDWTVEKVPTYIKDSTGKFTAIDDAFATTRSSDGKILGRVGSDYKVCNNADAFSFLDSLIDSGEAVFDTAGSMYGGRRVFVTAMLPETVKIAGYDEHEVYLLASSSHDGSSAITVAATAIRVVCANTEAMALRSAKQTWTIRHTQSLEGKLQEARETLQLVNTYTDAFSAEVEKLLNVQVTDDKFKQILLDNMYYQKNATEKNIAGVLANRNESATITAAERSTAWGAYNALTEWVQHGRAYRTGEARMRATVGGWAQSLSSKVARDLVKVGS